MTPGPAPTPLRQVWLRTLALSPAPLLARHADPVLTDFSFDELRPPECGLVLLRARIGGDGARFNLGEATATRCAVRHEHEGRSWLGVGQVLGRDLDQARRIACLDALLQRDDLRAALERDVLQPLHAARQARLADEHAATEATRVHFHTLPPESPA